MSDILSIISPVASEVFLLTAICVILVVDLFLEGEYKIFTYLLSQLALLVTATIVIGDIGQPSAILFSGEIIRDDLGSILKLVLYIVAVALFMYSDYYLKYSKIRKGEFYILGLFGILGMSVLISAHSLLTIYLGLELMSLSMYAMVALQRDSKIAVEAAMKYFVLGAIASGMLLYGISILYGMSGSLDLVVLSKTVQNNPNDVLIILGLIFVLAGIAFKLGAVPFHMWLPDVYAGAPTIVTLYISSIPKLAAFAMMVRLLVEGMSGLVVDWQQALIFMAALSIGLGNIIAIAQTNIKRMLAYSAISHAGFLLLGILSGTESGLAAAMFYTISYTLTSAAAFGMILLLGQKSFEIEEITDLTGLGRRSPWLAFLLLIILFSLAGVPPTVGFYAKLSVLQAVVDVNLVWLAVYAVFFSVVGAFYYLRVVKVIYFDSDDNEESQLLTDDKLRTGISVMLSCNTLSLLLLGIFPGVLMVMCTSVFGI